MKKLLLLIAMLGLGGCKSNFESKVTAEVTGQSLESLKVDLNRYAANKLVCDPFQVAPMPTVTYEKGIKADLYYRDQGQDRFFKTTDYFTKTTKSDKTLFLSDINIPTRAFTEGFSTPTGTTLSTNSGEKLIEFFALKMTTNIILSDEDEAGEYELALLADDGANLIIKSGTDENADQIVIANDGDHGTKLGCANQTIRFRKNVMLPVEISYYQGPRFHIANMLLWRKSDSAGKDSSCGKVGNSMYFDSKNKSSPQPEFLNMQSRGWKVLKPENFVVAMKPGDYNPCVNATPPIISNFVLGEVTFENVSLSWSTDLSSTAQILLINTRTGVETVTESDNLLRTSHTVILSGLDPSTTYKVKAISVTKDLGRAQSTELQFTTF